MLEQLLPAEAFAFLIIFVRLGALFSVAPALGETSIPVNIRLTIALLTTAVLYISIGARLPAEPTSVSGLAGLVITEFAIGLMIGLVARLMLTALHVAGTVIAFQSGLAFSQQFDPTQGGQSAINASFLTLMGVTLIFVTDLHLLTIRALEGSYDLFPPGAPLPIADFNQLVVRTVAESFTLGMQIAAPFLLFGMVFNFALGLIARLMPQLPVFFIAMPLNIFIGFLIFLIAVPSMMLWFLRQYEDRLAAFLG